MKTTSFDDFKKLDIRVGTVIEAEVPKWSHWVMKLTVDLGDPPAGGGKKTVFAGIKKYYKPEDVIGKQVVVVTNLEPKKIGPEGDFSEAMILAASVPAKSGKDPVSGGASDERPVLLCVSDKVPNGTKVR
ncbi:methionine--tRNA ligase [Patescibacteria group bacterium]|nr:methionine--tRNA ligase [Patescibacteria group bacterium]